MHVHVLRLTRMRTPIELKDERRARLLELTARRGEKGFSSLIAEAVDAHLRRIDESEDARTRARREAGLLVERGGRAPAGEAPAQRSALFGPETARKGFTTRTVP